MTAEKLSARAELPHVLSKKDGALYKKIFGLGERGDWQTVDTLIAQLDDRLLLGHVLAQRYLHATAYRPRFDELAAWMKKYADQPDAARIRDLALRRKPKSVRGVPLLASRFEAPRLLERRLASLPESTPTEPTQAALDLNPERIGETGLTGERDLPPFEMAATTGERPTRLAREAQWNAGLAAWRAGAFGYAAQRFEATAKRSDASSWTVSAAAFWAARAHLFDRRPENVTYWLRVAASHPRTFYGLLARRILGLPMPFEWHNPAKERAALTLLSHTEPGRRALALLQIGQRPRAERELRSLSGRTNRDVVRGIIAAAHRSGMAELAFRLNSALFPEGGGFDAADYPIPDWRPEGGFTVDRALIYALIRQESGFRSDAASRAGARGLMQLMPTTARYVAGSAGLRPVRSVSLGEPKINLTLGQKYLEMLLDDENVGGDLFRLAAAWNGGPGNLQKWWREAETTDDPLLFIESIPLEETRVFIERVLANLWIYHNRLGQPAPSLDALAAGSWPVYTPLDGTTIEVAENGQR